MPALPASIPAKPGAPLVIDAARYRVLRKLAKQRAGDLFFAGYFLSKARRYALWSLDALRHQFEEILGCPQTGRDKVATPSTCSSGGCSTSGGGCEGESIETRRQVCRSVLDHLYNGLDTGKPELDAFLQVRAAWDLPREKFEAWIEGAAMERSLPRYATWKRLSDALAMTGGAPAALAASVMGAESEALASFTIQGQIDAWGAAMRFIRVIETVGEDWKQGRLMLPLDDLVKAGLSEQDIARFTQAGTTGGDGRWSRFMQSAAERIRNLMRGGARALAVLKDSGSRRAAAAIGVFAYDRFDRLLRAGGDPFAAKMSTSTWRRLRLMPRASRLALEPMHAAKVFG